MNATFWIQIAAAGFLLLCLDVVGTTRLWRDSTYERSQKFAQTALIWVVPGFAFVVLYMLKVERDRSSRLDPTITDPGVHPYIQSHPGHTGGDGHNP